MTEQVKVRIADIKIGERVRKDYGDIDALADSIRRQGLLQPIAVTADLTLVGGERRIMAVKKIGMDEIPAHVVDPAELIEAERDENTVRKDFTPTEAVAIGRLVEEVHRSKIDRSAITAKARQVLSGTNEPDSDYEPIGRAYEVAAPAVGLSPPTYKRAKAVVTAAEQDPERFGDLPDAMDETGNVTGTYREMKRRQDDTGTAPAPVAAKKQPTNRAVTRLDGLRDQMAGLAGALPTVQPVDGYDPAELITELATVRREIASLIKRLQAGATS